MQKSNQLLVYSAFIHGHYLEYIHHIYMGALVLKRPTIIVVPHSFQELREQLDWPENEFVHFNFITDEQKVTCSRLNLLRQALNSTLTLRKLILKHHVRQVFITNLGIMMPFVALLLPWGTRVSGVIYRIYLYEWAKSNWKKRMQDALKFYLMACCKRIDHPFILNDAIASAYLNRKFSTKKFEEIIDPMNVINYTPQNIRSELGVKNCQKMFVHLGGLGERKGTMNIIEVMEKMTIDELKQNVFVFAGKVGNDIRTEFYQRIQSLQKNANIKIFDERIPFEQMADLCHSCDAILLPYSNTMQSSGIISYASMFGHPVIGPSDGLLGKIIRKYRLGYACDVSSDGLLCAIRQFKPMSIDSRYVDSHTIELFYQTVYKKNQ